MSIFQPLVSIVIPVYNGANYMREAIDSALAQTYDNCEVLVINDGSTDNGETDRIARSYGDRIRYFLKENGGVATALNLGIREMRGEYFSWLSHDDVYVPEKIEAQVTTLREQFRENTIIFSDFCYINEKGEHLWDHHILPEASHDMLSYLFERGEIHGCTLLIPRRAFFVAGMFPEHLHTTQDYELWFSMARTCSFVQSTGILVRSRIHKEQSSASIPKHKNDVLELYDRHLDSYIALKQSPLGGERNALRRLLRVWVLQGRQVQAQHLVRLCLERQGGGFAKEMKLRYTWLMAMAVASAFLEPLRKTLRPLKQALLHKQGLLL